MLVHEPLVTNTSVIGSGEPSGLVLSRSARPSRFMRFNWVSPTWRYTGLGRLAHGGGVACAWARDGAVIASAIKRDSRLTPRAWNTNDALGLQRGNASNDPETIARSRTG